MNEVMRQRIIDCKMLAVAGVKTYEIARKLNCSPRTINRYINIDLGDEKPSFLALNEDRRAQFLKEGWPVVIAAMRQLQERIDGGSMRDRDLVSSIGVLFDRIRICAPEPTRPTVTVPTLTVNWTCTDPAYNSPPSPQLVEGNPGDVTVDDGAV